MLTLGVTSVGDFGDCRRKFAWHNIDRWRKADFFLSRETGTLFHAWLEGYYTARKKGYTVSLAEVEGYAALDEASSNLEYELGYEFAEDITSAFELATGMAQGYTDPFLWYEILEVEYPVQYEVEGINIRGIIDLVVKDVDGNLIIVDHKTRSQFYPVDPFLLGMDQQLLTYAYLYEQLTGMRPDKVIHNEILRVAPSRPNILKNGSLSKAKTTLASTTYDLYLVTIEDEGLNRLDYVEELAALKAQGADKFNRQIEITILPEVYDNFTVNWTLALGDIQDMLQNRTWREYPNPSMYRCTKCVYREVCSARERGDDWAFMLRTWFEQKEL